VRRLVGAFGILIAAVAAEGQAPPRVRTVGVLAAGSSSNVLATSSRNAFEGGLKDHGWVEGQTIRIEYRYAEGRPQRLDEHARELVRLGVDVIVARATPSIRAAKQATSTIPIVMSGSGHDPVQLGFVASLGRPGGNITGLTLLNQDLPVKQLEMLRETVPRLSRVGVLGSRDFPLPPRGFQDLEAAAQTLAVQLHHVDVRVSDDLDRAFAEMVAARVGGVLVRSDPFVLEPNAARLIALAQRYRLPAVYWLDTYTQDGGLMSYGVDLDDAHRRSAFFVDRILRGAKPADLPVEQPSTFRLAVNLKTARALGLTVPPSVLARASEVIQ
jgi:putative tryptophan/tyrosine transport system substrate-binding protein